MKLLKIGLRFWITLGSVFSFLFGWAVLAHSLKPTQPVTQPAQIAPMPTLEPLPPIGSDPNFQSNQPAFDVQSFFQPRAPRFVTGGS